MQSNKIGVLIGCLVCVITLLVVFFSSRPDTIANFSLNQNLETMKMASFDYFTPNNLPARLAQKRVMTLREMIDRRLVSEIQDEYNQICNLGTSFVEVMKIDNDMYRLKINLSCGNNEKHITNTIICDEICNFLH